MDPKHRHFSPFVPAVTAIFLLLILYSGNVRYTGGDSRFGLLTSQAILEHGTIHLDKYASEIDLSEVNHGKDWMLSIDRKEGHIRYFYPIGTPLFSLPFVAVGRIFGLDMLLEEDDRNMQIFISGIIFICVFFQLFRLGRIFLKDWEAWGFALMFLLGSSFVSTGGTALWSQNFQVLFILTALTDIAGVQWGEKPSLRPYRLGALLFAAWLCRPQTAPFILAVFIWVAVRHRKSLLKLSLAAGIPLILFFLWSKWEYGRFLPYYFDPDSFPWTGNVVSNFLAGLFSPARGLLIFTPLLLLSFLTFFIRPLRKDLLFWLIWGWILVHLLMIANAGIPWGGWSYGPRLLMETLPGFACLLLLLFHYRKDLLLSPLRRGIVLSLGISGIFIHTWQGLYNPNTYYWNGGRNIDQVWEEMAWNWDEPQFLASDGMIRRKEMEKTLFQEIGPMLGQIPVGSAMLYGDQDPDLRRIFRSWNKQKRFGKWRVYNSLAALHSAGRDTFFVRIEDRHLIPENSGYTIRDVESGLSLGEFLEKNEDQILLIAARDEANYQLSPETKRIFRAKGSQIDSLKFRESYLAVFVQGDLILEKMGKEKLKEELPQREGFPEIELISAGMPYGNVSKIEVDGEDWGRNGRGMNVVVMTSRGELIWSTHFDTHAQDRESVRILEVSRIEP